MPLSITPGEGVSLNSLFEEEFLKRYKGTWEEKKKKMGNKFKHHIWEVIPELSASRVWIGPLFSLCISLLYHTDCSVAIIYFNASLPIKPCGLEIRDLLISVPGAWTLCFVCTRHSGKLVRLSAWVVAKDRLLPFTVWRKTSLWMLLVAHFRTAFFQRDTEYL